MIPFGSQRALGQDLATHLLNTQDNERMEVAQVRGAVARDLHGAFAEWEAQAHTLTRCTNYLYSLSINPDQRQGRLTKEQYLDYIDRAENRLGLSGQPRAVVFHVKKDKNGVPREHCHVIWSRIDAERGKARHIAFDHDKLMMVTREFARDHGLKLPDGYYRDKGQERPKKNRQLTLYEKNQQDKGGLSKEQHMAQVTAAWHKRDTPRAFVRSLEDMGYILATGTRDYVLVDLLRQHEQPAEADRRQESPHQGGAGVPRQGVSEGLPAERGRGAGAGRRPSRGDGAVPQGRGTGRRRRPRQKERREALQRKQQDRRAPLWSRKARRSLTGSGRPDRNFATRQKDDRAALRQGYLQESQRIRLDRAAHRPQGLAAFIGRITGVELITKKIQQYRDKTRYDAFLAQKAELTERQQRETAALERRQELETLTMQRRLRALELVEQRELRSLETALLKERRIEERERTGREPAPIEPSPTHTDEFNKAAKKPIDLTAEFERAAGSGEAEGGASGDSSQDPAPESEIKIQRRRRTRDQSPEVERSARTKRSDRDPENDGPLRR